MRVSTGPTAHHARDESIRLLRSLGLRSAALAVELNHASAIRDYHNTVADVVRSAYRKGEDHGLVRHR